MVAQFTPGPWRVAVTGNVGNLVEAQSGRTLYDGDDGCRGVAMVQSCGDFPFFAGDEANRLANGHLIAAAPDLYEALIGLVARIEHRWPNGLGTSDWVDPHKAAVAALAKARGEA